VPAKGGFPRRLLQCMIFRFLVRSLSVGPGSGQTNCVLELRLYCSSFSFLSEFFTSQPTVQRIEALFSALRWFNHPVLAPSRSRLSWILRFLPKGVLGLGCWVFSFIRQRGLRHFATISATLCVGCLPYLAGGFLMGGPIRYAFSKWTVAAMASLYPVCYVYVYIVRTDSSDNRCKEEAAI